MTVTVTVTYLIPHIVLASLHSVFGDEPELLSLVVLNILIFHYVWMSFFNHTKSTDLQIKIKTRF